MSLFPDDDLDTRPKQPSSSLFSDPPASKATGGGLFDDSNGVDDAAPWGLPTPKKAAARSSPVKSLLSATDVPDAYIDAFDALLDAGESSASHGVSVVEVRKMLASGGLDSETQDKILGVVQPSGQKTDGLGRNEFNVLFALIGLAQEGDDITLDSVDERRRRLPMPKVSLPKKQEAADARQENAPHPPPAAPATNTRAPMAKQSFGDPEADPWGTPDMHRGHEHANYTADATHTNGTGAPITTRTTSQFTTSTSENSTAPAPDPTGAAASSYSSEGGWGAYPGGSESHGFSQNPVAAEGFGQPPSGGGLGLPTGLGRSLGGGRVAASGPEEVVTVTTIAEKEGLFMFQHRNYEVTSPRRNSKVVRRYSDFVWLLDCLHKRYPFRQLPLLPPKRVAINGNYIAADAGFVEKRRRGLGRFVNALVRHPVLAQEQLVVMFLTVPTELAVWRKQATISVQEEFTGRTLPPELEDSLPKSLPDLFDTTRSGVRQSAESYINLCNMMERLTKRNEGMAVEHLRFAGALTSLTEASQDTYATDANDVPLLNEGLKSTAKHLEQSRALLEDEARGWENGVLEDLKRQRDTLVSMRDLFDRRDRYAKDNIPYLESRIEKNEVKLRAIRNKPAGTVKVGEAEKVEDAISRDKESIVAQHARGVFIRECVRDELLFFQQSQYHVSSLLQDWAQERVKYAELQAENWRALSEEVEGMGVGGGS